MFFGNFAGSLTVALFMVITFTFVSTGAPNAVGVKIGSIGESRTARRAC